MSESYGVKIEQYCDSHYIKDFVKKYSDRRWELTLESIKKYAAKPGKTAGQTNRMNFIAGDDERKIFKGEFKMHGTNVSAKSSGNRFILAANTKKELSRILLIYKKQDHVKGKHETAWWQGIIKDRYPELADLLS